MTTTQKAEKLIELSNYEGTEAGEYWYSISKFYLEAGRHSQISDDLSKMIEQEVEEHYDWVMENYTVVKTEVTEQKTVTELEFNG